ncbi:MAG TPA: hypothetical protein DCY12_10645 [Candidatus Atribacteria bacterium]|nr:hypothetical protein [Candidatus Atribacteria bacterium]
MDTSLLVKCESCKSHILKKYNYGYWNGKASWCNEAKEWYHNLKEKCPKEKTPAAPMTGD